MTVSTLSLGRKVATISLVPNNAQRQFLESATETYYRSLPGSPAAEYLEKERGLSGDSAMRFRLGYVAEPLVGHEYLSGRLAIPYLTRSGVVSLKFRRLGEMDGPKYLYASGTVAKRIFNPNALFDDRPFICICEGELDAITAEQCGLPAVGIAGVDNWQPYFARVFAGYEDVFLLGDNDDKGQGENFAHALAKLVPNSKVVLMPDGHDVNSLVLEQGPEALLRKVGIK